MLRRPSSPLMSQLSLLGCGSSGGGGEAVYENTAFLLNTGNDGTAALNNPALPYRSTQAALDALEALGVPCTLWLLDDCDGDGSGVVSETLADAGLTIKAPSPDGGYVLSGQLVMQGAADSLTLEDIEISDLRWTDSNSGTSTPATITGVGTVVITTLEAKGADGSNGMDGGDATATWGSNGSDAPAYDPPANGGDGVTADANGTDGGAATSGGFGRAITVSGPVTISSANLSGGAGGDGGNGGNANAATGGAGGNGGLAAAPTEPQDGGNGGNGGDAFSYGGAGRDGGNGGNGGNLTLLGGASCTSFTSAGGAGGNGGLGGTASTATGGSGGSGGNGVNGGNTGTAGSNGASNFGDGSDGMPGTSGSPGSIL